MIERRILLARAEFPDPSETASEARARLADRFPKTALRRMTHPGMLAGAALHGVPIRADDAIVYATTFAETRALEDYLGSFPAPSPLLFQTSIHPSAIQQVMIARQQPIARFWPMTGRDRLVESALLAALLETADRVVLVGAEEKATWLLRSGMGSARSFAFAAVLARVPEIPIPEAEGEVGRIAFRPGASVGDEPAPSLEVFADALAGRRPLAWRGAGGDWSVAWS